MVWAASSAALASPRTSRRSSDRGASLMISGNANPAMRLLYVVNEDYAFLLNRLPMARAARDAGFEVHVATNVKNARAAIEAEGFVLHQISFRRGGLSPFAAMLAVRAI